MEPDTPAWTRDALQDALLVATRFQILHSQSPLTFLFPVPLALVVALLLRPVSAGTALTAWVVLIGVLAAVRCTLLARARPGADPAGAVIWLNRFAAGACVSGLLWGAAPILLVPRQPERVLEATLFSGLLMLVVCGLVAGAAVAYAASLRVLFSFTVPALLPPGCWLISLGDRFNGALGGFVLLYLLFISTVALRMHLQLRRFFEVEYELNRLRLDLGGNPG
jgi:hypothetical protein